MLRHPAMLEVAADQLPPIETEHLVLVANAPPIGIDGREYYQPAVADRIARELFGVAPIWAPIGPLVRDVIASDVPAGLRDQDWVNIIDVDAWHVERPSWRSDRPVIGRHSRPSPQKWPTDSKAIEAVYVDLVTTTGPWQLTAGSAYDYLTRQLAAASGLPVPQRPRVSVLLCTRRPDCIAFGLAQIDRQRHVDLEVVLTLHGQDADTPEVQAAIETSRWPVSVVHVPGEVAFGDALNRGAAAATGAYIAKWDDDDWYGPEFIADALLAAEYSGADLVGCLHQFVCLGPIKLTVHRPGGESERFTRRISQLVADPPQHPRGRGRLPADRPQRRHRPATRARGGGRAHPPHPRYGFHGLPQVQRPHLESAADRVHPRGGRPVARVPASALMEFAEFSEEMNSLMSPR